MAEPHLEPTPSVAKQLVDTDILLHVENWDDFKQIVVNQKGLRLNHLETSTHYDVRGADTERFSCVLLKGTPEAADFEEHFKFGSNARYDARSVLVTESGVLAITEFGATFPSGGTAVAGKTASGDTSPLGITSLGALKTAAVEHSAQRISLSATSPSTPGVVPQAGVAVPEGMTNIKIEATLATTDGTPTGGKLSAWLQTSVDGSDWSDWLPLMLDVVSGTEPYSVRYADAPPPASIEGVVPVGKNMTPSATLPAGGIPDNYLRVIFSAGSGTDHGVSQTIWLIGNVPV